MCTYTMQYYSAIKKKERNFTICNNMDGLGGYYTKWINQTEKQLLCDITPMWTLKDSTNYST